MSNCGYEIDALRGCSTAYKILQVMQIVRHFEARYVSASSQSSQKRSKTLEVSQSLNRLTFCGDWGLRGSTQVSNTYKSGVFSWHLRQVPLLMWFTSSWTVPAWLVAWIEPLGVWVRVKAQQKRPLKTKQAGFKEFVWYHLFLHLLIVVRSCPKHFQLCILHLRGVGWYIYSFPKILCCRSRVKEKDMLWKLEHPAKENHTVSKPSDMF